MTRLLFLMILISLYGAGAQIPVENDANDNKPTSHLKYIASFQLARTEVEFFCAGVFISDNSVLTLATCFYQNDALLNPDDVRVVAGSQFRYDSDRNTFSAVLKEIVIHKNFSRSSLENNLAIAVISLTVPDDNIEVLDLENIAIHPPSEGVKCRIYGWSLMPNFEVSPHLISNDVTIGKKENCDVASNKVTSTTICAGPYFANACETDDGSPLVCNNKLYGLVDYRQPEYCSQIVTNRLGTYIELAQFHDWIADHISSGEKLTLSRLLIPLVIVLSAL